MKDLSIIIADDHPLLLKGLSDYLSEKNYLVIGSATDGNEAYNLITSKKPDVAILDIQMPILTGLEIAKKCKTNNHSTKIVLITFHKEKSIFKEAQELGVHGFILKEFALDEIENCLSTISKGLSYISPQLSLFLHSKKQGTDILEKLTTTEKKILSYIAKDKTNKEIAAILFVSYRTIEKHRSNIIAKLHLEQKTNSLLLWAKENQDELNY
ncbi:MAG: response regulator [Flavobacteriales bacterium]